MSILAWRRPAVEHLESTYSAGNRMHSTRNRLCRRNRSQYSDEPWLRLNPVAVFFDADEPQSRHGLMGCPMTKNLQTAVARWSGQMIGESGTELFYARMTSSAPEIRMSSHPWISLPTS